MKLINCLPLLLLILTISCADQKEAEDKEEIAEADIRKPAEANAQWVDAWNRNNPKELDTLTANDAVLYMEGQQMNADSIRSWYNNAAPMMKDLKTNAQVEYATGDIAYEAGTYSHGIKNDSLNTTYEGTYTFIWKKSNNDWKLQVMNITDKEQDTTAAE
ncbi:hypothetical protein GCM10023115_36710 [Pontixanthobacter gangjinensis]|uniref:Nuclear transport factor 2 family protein n=1 Tax=Christiangramia aestuarii TaxID=1028746 RepID=A0A7K1LRC4_9FLAO|nr:nuclear transport factor 2 family protein [Christiangramia aestuarii]MUP43161.1 nuclear transport factor 2 family protein [Christiangramia aestuarii]